MRYLLLTGLAIILFSNSKAILAFDESKYEKAESIFTPRVKYPGSQGNFQQSGYVMIETIIGSNGKILAPVVFMSSHKGFEEQVIKAFNSYTYKPAKHDGVEVDSRSPHIVFFHNSSYSTGVSSQFNANFQKGMKFLSEKKGNQKKFEKIIKRLSQSSNLNFHGLMYKALLEYYGSVKYGSLADQKRSALNVFFFEKKVRNSKILKSEEKASIKLHLIELQIKFGQYMEAIKTFHELRREFPKHSKMLEPSITKIKTLIASGKPYQQNVFLNKRGDDFLLLSGNEFYIEGVNGEIENLHFRCQAKYKKLKFNQENNYRVPQSWGECRLQIEGIPKTEAKLIQMGKGNKFEEVSASSQKKD